MTTMHSTGADPTPANRLGLDYTAEASRMGPPPVPIIDVHSHVTGLQATKIYRKAAELYGIGMTYSMSPLEQCEAIRDMMDGKIHFIAVPNYWSAENKRHAMTDGYLERVEQYYELGSRIVKFWVAPRSIDYAMEMGEPDLLKLDAPHKIRVMERATELGMMFMVHVADPDTWFKTRYIDSSVYGTKSDQYKPLETLLDRFTQPWIAAHMGGWPEDLEFLTGLLERHDNLHLDTSACKWMVRELSKHPREELIAFLTKFKGRILFGSDIVSSDDHLKTDDSETEMAAKAGSEAEAFDLYASRYWALRTLWEGDYDGESPIADPDLALVSPDEFDEMSAPRLSGKSLPTELLRDLYHDAPHALLSERAPGYA